MTIYLSVVYSSCLPVCVSTSCSGLLSEMPFHCLLRQRKIVTFMAIFLVELKISVVLLTIIASHFDDLLRRAQCSQQLKATALLNCSCWCTSQKYLIRWLLLLSLYFLLSADVRVTIYWPHVCMQFDVILHEKICFTCQVTLACSKTLVCQCCQATAPASHGTKPKICPSLFYRAELTATCPLLLFF